MDYFVLSEGLKPAVQEVSVIEGARVAKHLPVKLILDGRLRSDTVLTLARPPPRPAAPPAACQPRPLPSDEWVEDLPLNFSNAGQEELQDVADQRYKD